jgi:tRNA 2-thiouridine synthesizing protein A
LYEAAARPVNGRPRRKESPSRAMTRSAEATETILDLRGVRCPHVVLRAKKALRTVPVGGILVLECTDPLTVIDVPHFVTQTGHRLQAKEQRGKLLVFRIVKQA